MKGKTRWIALVLILELLCSFAVPAGAEVMTLGVSFRGVTEREDGTEIQVALAGSFRVTQGGMDQGVIQAGVTTVTVSGTDPVTLIPMPETIDPGWDLAGARTTVNMTESGTVTVPILVKPLKEQTAPADNPGAEETQTSSAGMPEENKEAQTADGSPELSDGTAEETEEPAGISVQNTEPAATPAWSQTAVPTAEPTPEPAVSLLSGGADTGTFHLKVFFDSNNNGDCSVYEKGVSGVQVYLVAENGEIVTGGKTDSEGEVILPGLQPGTYRVRAYLEEKWGFNRKSKDTGLNKSIMNFSTEGNQDSDPISVSAGKTVERGIGLLKGVTVDGVCWLDEDSDGIMDANEPRIAGVRVTMTGQKNGLEFEAFSDENGYWRIIRMRAGFYDFTGYAPEGMAFTRYSKTGGKNRSVFTAEGKTRSTRTLDTNDGKDVPDQNIGFIPEGSVRGIAFLDANYNGLYDEGEKPLAGVKVTAIKQLKEEEVAVAYSGEDGRYVLSGLRGNTYKIRAVLPEDGSNFTKVTADPDGNHFAAREARRENFWKDFELKDGETRTVNVGAVYYGSVSGTVYMDDDFSATRNGSEKVAQGISVTLLREDGTQVETKQTSARGTYTFTDLTPGRYSLWMTAKDGYAFTRLGEGSVMLNLNGGEGYSESFEVPLGESITGKDAGMIMPGTVKGLVFADRNDNGRQDPGEAGLAGTAVRLMSEDGEAFSAVLDESGAFLFDAVMPGRYYLEYRLPEGAIFAREGGDSAISGENGTGRGEWFNFRTADWVEAPLCGALTLGSISGTAFHDPDGSGTMENGDTPIAGVRIVLIPERDDLSRAEAETDETGSFELPDLHPDNYTLQLQLPEGMVTSRTTGVSLPVTAGMREQEATLTVGMGEIWKDQMIGAVIPAALAGRAWLDENNNGLLEEGEETPEGLALTVTDEGTGEVFRVLHTNEEGFFEFSGMVPGSYTASYEMDENSDLPPEGDHTFRKEGNLLVMSGITLAENETRDDLILGLVKYTSLGGRTWIDRGNGAEALGGAVIRLLDEDGETLQTQTTSENGTWRFSGLMPGTFLVQAEMPEGTVAVEPDDERLETGLVSVLQETDGRTGLTDPIELKMGRDQLHLDAGAVLPGTIGDYCWLDVNGNGWQDGGELGIPGVKVELVRNGEAVAETETDQYGLYFFREVYPAVYTLRVTAPEQVRPTQKRNDIYLIVSALTETESETAYTEEFAVASDSTDFNIDLGYVLRTPGAYPPGYGEQETMDWSKAYEGVELK